MGERTLGRRNAAPGAEHRARPDLLPWVARGEGNKSRWKRQRPASGELVGLRGGEREGRYLKTWDMEGSLNPLIVMAPYGWRRAGTTPTIVVPCAIRTGP